MAGSLTNPFHAGFSQGLRQIGYIEGQNIVIEYRGYEGLPDRAAEIAADFVRSKVDLIVVVGPAGSKAVRDVARSIPVVFTLVADPLGDGLVESIARPGRNMTGVALAPTPAVTRSLSFFTQALPHMSRIALLWNPASTGNEHYFDHAREAANSFKLNIQSLPARNVEEIDAALAAMARGRAEGLVIVAEALLTTHRARIIDYATQRGIPTASYLPQFAQSGSLLAYGPDPTQLVRRAAVFVDRILKGGKPGDIPVEQPTTFTLVVNQKSAKALKLSIPPSLLARADQVIE